MLEILSVVPWLLLLLLSLRGILRRPRLASYEAAAAGPLVSVIVPARNEAGNIGTCLATLTNTDYADCEILVVDDRSSDGTDAIVRALVERSSGAVRLVEGRELPDGWIGKPWACWQGYEAARGDVLLFTDADTRHDAELLGKAVTALEASQADLLTVMPRQELGSFWERVVMPHIMFVLGLRYPLSRMNRTENPRDVVANGQFIMMPRASYEAVDGHRAVKDEVVEDLRLAQTVVGHGRKLYGLHAEEHMETRMYRSLRTLVAGWSKNLAMGSRMSVPRWMAPLTPWLMALFFFGAWVAPPVTTVYAWLGPDGPLLTWGLWTTILSLTFWLIMTLRLHVPPLYALVYPLGGVVTAAIATRSALRGRRVEWKGREYRTA